MEFFCGISFVIWAYACPDDYREAVHYIFSFPKEGKEKDVISIPLCKSWFQKMFAVKLIYLVNKNNYQYILKSHTINIF